MIYFINIVVDVAVKLTICYASCYRMSEERGIAESCYTKVTLIIFQKEMQDI